MSKLEAAAEINMNKALKGDFRAFAKIIEVLDKLGSLELPPEEMKAPETTYGDAREKLSQLIEAVSRADEQSMPDCKDTKGESDDVT